MSRRLERSNTETQLHWRVSRYNTGRLVHVLRTVAGTVNLQELPVILIGIPIRTHPMY